MADLTMCTSYSCPIRRICHRATAYKSEYQMVSKFEVDLVNGKVVCDHFWDNEGYRKYDNDNKEIK